VPVIKIGLGLTSQSEQLLCTNSNGEEARLEGGRSTDRGGSFEQYCRWRMTRQSVSMTDANVKAIVHVLVRVRLLLFQIVKVGFDNSQIEPYLYIKQSLGGE
jgi:hypothetical protein